MGIGEFSHCCQKKKGVGERTRDSQSTVVSTSVMQIGCRVDGRKKNIKFRSISGFDSVAAADFVIELAHHMVKSDSCKMFMKSPAKGYPSLGLHRVVCC